MAKKKASIIGIGTIGLGVIIAVVVALYITTGFPFQFFPVSATDDQQLLDDINNLPPEFQLPIGDVIVEPTVPIEVILGDDQFPIPNTDVTIIDPLDEVEINNMTVVVNPDGTVVDPEPIPVPFDVSISSVIFKTDNNGTRTESTTNFEIPLFAFFVEDTTNLDFDNGFIEQQLNLNAEPNTQITLDANFDVLIANQTILPEPLTISVSGVTDQNGQLSIDYVNPVGLKSKDYFFSFADHVDKFNATATDKVEYVIDNVRVSSDDFEYELESAVIYEITIARDPNRIIIIDESGGKARIFPTDDVINVSSTASSYTYVRTSRVYPYTRTYSACCVPAPAMGGGEFTHILNDGSEQILASFQANSAGSCTTIAFGGGTTCTKFPKITNLLIQRDEIYRLDVTSPTKASITFKTPIEQKSYSFFCKTNLSSGVSTLNCNFLSPTLQQQLADTLVEP
jgi:hypothetical protein